MNSIKAIRDRLGVSQKELAEAVGRTQGNVGFYEHGQTVPPEVAKKLIAYAARLGHVVTYQDIYGDPLVTELAADESQGVGNA